MSTNKTENLNLHSWTKSDPVKMEEFNENFSAIDAAVGALRSELTHFQLGYYTGTGKVAEAPVTLSFDFTPKLLLVFVNAGQHATPEVSPITLVWGVSGSLGLVGAGSGCLVTYNGNTVSWRRQFGGNGETAAAEQLNTNGRRYYYAAIG